MNVRDIADLVEEWAPPELAWERDNAGLQVGSFRRRVKRVLIALDLTDEVVEEAIRKKADLIITHHPLLYHPLKTVQPDERVGRIVVMLVRANIAVYAAHTNLDFAEGGVSAVLAKRLGLKDIRVLDPARQILKKISVFVPPDHLEPVLASMAGAGAGQIGKYDECSFGTEGTGTFRPMAGAEPYIGAVGRREATREIRLEMIAPAWKVGDVVEAMQQAHPYEEVAYDIYDIANTSRYHGAGAIGDLPKGMQTRAFLRMVSRVLRTPALRCTAATPRTVERVAVCGGGGSDLMSKAIQQGADALVTADVTYHRFEEAGSRILLVDAGHYETEALIVPALAEFLRAATEGRGASVQIHTSTTMKNHVHYFLS